VSEARSFDHVAKPATNPDPSVVLATIDWHTDSPPKPVTGGWDNHIWRFERDGEPFALRLVRLDPWAAPGSQARATEQEVAAIAVAAAAGLPAPQVVATGEFEGAPFTIQRWLPGAPIIDAAKHAPWLTRRLGREFGRLQARMHTVPGGALRSIAQTDWVERAEHPGLVAYVRETTAAVPPKFCHFDFHPLNVLAEGTQITGLVDFANASGSDPRADLGLTNALLRAAPAPPGLTRKVIDILRRRFIAGWREGYIDYAGHFPLEPAFEALGYAIYMHEFTQAMNEGRGWADERDIARLRTLRDERLAAAGLG
jgi:aminoglycoside phosphotransferase (APT) family kinase protein